MLIMHKDGYDITICDCFTEGLIHLLKENKQILADDDVEDHLCDRIINQQHDGSSFYNFVFDKSDDYQALCKEQVIQFSVPKIFVFVKMKNPIKIRKGSPYESLNEDDAFLKALNEQFKEHRYMYAYYLPVTYSKNLSNKCGEDTSNITLQVDIPFSEIEVPS